MIYAPLLPALKHSIFYLGVLHLLRSSTAIDHLLYG